MSVSEDVENIIVRSLIQEREHYPRITLLIIKDIKIIYGIWKNICIS